MKKIVVLLLFVFTFSLHSFEWGGILNESISNSKESYTEDSFLFTQKKLSGFMVSNSNCTERKPEFYV